MNKFLTTGIAAACISLALSVNAAETQPMQMNMATAKTMMGADGTISKDSFMKHGGNEAAWTKMDLNKDGKLDANEIKLGFNDK